MNSGYIQERVENVFTHYISSSFANSSFNYYTGINDEEEKNTPCIIVQSNSATEDFPGGGVWHVDTRILFVYPYEDSGSLFTRNQLYETFVGLIYNDNLAENISPFCSNQSCSFYDVIGSGLNTSIQGSHWVGEIPLDVITVAT